VRHVEQLREIIEGRTALCLSYERFQMLHNYVTN